MLLHHDDNKYQLGRLANAFKLSFKELGYGSDIFYELDHAPEDVSKEDCLLAISWASFRHPLHESWGEVGGVLMYNMTEIGESNGLFFRKWAHKVGRFKAHCPAKFIAILDYAPFNKPYTEKLGDKNIWCPIGYHESFEIRDCGPVEKTYDCLFLGSYSGERRINALNKLAEKFSVRTIGKGSHKNLNSMEFTRPKSQEFFNKEILSARTFISIHRTEKNKNLRDLALFGWAIPNKLPVVIEESSWTPANFGNGKHWVTCSLDKIPREVDRLVRSDTRRAEIADAAYQQARKRWNMRDHLKKALNEI